MEISPRKPSKRSQEPVDEWLQNEGYFRKLAPRDPTCLFRAVSEQVYLTQHYHIRVRKECVEFMKKMKHLFIENITIPFDDYLEQMACFTEWGGMNEIQAMSLLYKRDFIIFYGQKQINRIVTNNGFADTIYLCHTSQKQYESIYSKEFVATAAYCQSIVYQTLYKDVFQMENIEDTVHKMLHDRMSTYRHEKFFLKDNLEIRDELTSEIITKLESGTDEVDNMMTVSKTIPPFPYRIAKALDPNIYRNTDFDIWHEIRREVKNAGWTRHNSHELQIGGKCLVQMGFNEQESDKANNNSVYLNSHEKHSNGNDTKGTQGKGKDSVFYYGHIQEMSKNQGPVLVFIEELGEKKIVPYSALKPLPLKKTKQNNWLPTSKRNVSLDSSPKYKKPCSTTQRKIKEPINGNVLANNVNKNENNGNNANDVKKNSFQWKDGPLKVTQRGYENYPMEKSANYTTNNSIETFPTRNILDNVNSSALVPARQENNKERKERTSFMSKNSENNLMKNSKSDHMGNSEYNTSFNSFSKQRMQKEVCYPPYSGDTAAQMDHMLRSINCSVQKSVDVNGGDLPLSDPFTLRFFYNLGLEYFRGNTNWNYLTNGQSPGFGQLYQGILPNEMDAPNVTNGVIQDCTLTQKGEHNNNQKETGTVQSMCQEIGDKYMNIRDTSVPKAEVRKLEDGKDMYSTRDKMKEQESINKDATSRVGRNGLGPRFKKNTDTRYRPVQHFTPSTNQYVSNGSNPKPPKMEKEVKGDGANVQHLQSVPQQVYTPASALNSYQTSYMQQGMYPGLTYYANEAEGFANSYYPNGGYFPIPCLPHSEIPDNNAMQSFSPHLCPGIDYAQAYPGLCQPYVCPQPAPYTMAPQNIPEQWYAVAGQPHYMQYAPVLPVTAEAACNGVTPNANQNGSL